MDLKRKLAMTGLTLAVAFAAGQFVQGTDGQRMADNRDPDPVSIQPLAAPADAAIAVPQPQGLRLPAGAMLPAVTSGQPADLVLPVGDCTMQFDVSAQPLAMLGLSLLAPCNPGERVVLRHAGIAVTGRTSATGSLFLTLPALEPEAGVSVLFSDGHRLEAQTTVPEAANLRRFAVQWMAEDQFQIHAFEGDADYGMPGHISAGNPNRPLPGVPAKGGFLTMLGDAGVSLPMLAEVYTFPSDAGTPVRLVIEAAVTPATCDRELLGETLVGQGGQVTISDLSVVMPGCDAVGDYLVLKNLLPDPNIAAAE